jgi:hypothetical protein
MVDFSERMRTENYEQVYVPTLSELIEACGDGFYSLERIHPNGTWKALAQWIAKSFTSDTPDEAVAKLWLALNKK